MDPVSPFGQCTGVAGTKSLPYGKHVTPAGPLLPSNRVCRSSGSRHPQRRTSSPRSATPSRSTTSSPIGSRPTFAGGTSGLRRFPGRAARLGDAICSSNPAYALGMSVAALQAEALRDSLAGGDGDLGPAGLPGRRKTGRHGLAADGRRRSGPAAGEGTAAVTRPGHQRLCQPGADRGRA